jgi:TOBE domain
VRPENVRLGVNGAAEPNTFAARVTAQRYQGTQTIYELALLGAKLDALELGTAARFSVGGDVAVVLPPALCWAYPAGDTAPE